MSQLIEPEIDIHTVIRDHNTYQYNCEVVRELRLKKFMANVNVNFPNEQTLSTFDLRILVLI